MIKINRWDGRVRRRLRELMWLTSSTMEQGAVWEFPCGFPHFSQACQWSCCSGSWVPLINARPGAAVGEVGILLLVRLKWQTRYSLLPTQKLEVLFKNSFLGTLDSIKKLCCLSKNTTSLLVRFKMMQDNNNQAGVVRRKCRRKNNFLLVWTATWKCCSTLSTHYRGPRLSLMSRSQSIMLLNGPSARKGDAGKVEKPRGMFYSTPLSLQKGHCRIHSWHSSFPWQRRKAATWWMEPCCSKPKHHLRLSILWLKQPTFLFPSQNWCSPVWIICL